MALLEIYTYPEQILREKSTPIEEVDRQCRKLIDDMVETMYDAPGIGLAANQVGQASRIVVMDLQRRDEEDDSGLIVMVNPRIISAQGSITFEEGCLSVPDYYAKVKRAEEVVVQAIDVNGKPFEMEASGFLAVVIQHELDHLEGRLFVDKLGPIAKDIFRRKWKKRQKEEIA
ncbi:MAG: peptide deformylase [Syntrophobacteraceae bacterium]